jgi:UDP-N-acetylmuramyl pentapeptide phosphotransferase/UDP-N-acetylglucosamine-1-phosphate transferase
MHASCYDKCTAAFTAGIKSASSLHAQVHIQVSTISTIVNTAWMEFTASAASNTSTHHFHHHHHQQQQQQQWWRRRRQIKLVRVHLDEVRQLLFSHA